MPLMPEPRQEITITEEHVPAPMTLARLAVTKEPGLAPTMPRSTPMPEGHQRRQIIPGLQGQPTGRVAQELLAADIPQESGLVLPAARTVHPHHRGQVQVRVQDPHLDLLPEAVVPWEPGAHLQDQDQVSQVDPVDQEAPVLPVEAVAPVAVAGVAVPEVEEVAINYLCQEVV